MAKRQDLLGVSGADTVIGTGVILKGDLQSDGDIVIDGQVNGTIKTTGTVTLTVNASVKADVAAQSTTVIGELKGNIKSDDMTTLRSTGRLIGNIETTTLEVEAGALFVGASKMAKHEAREVETPEMANGESAVN